MRLLIASFCLLLTPRSSWAQAGEEAGTEASAPAAGPLAAAQLLSATLGEDGLRLLAEKGYLVLQGAEGSRRVEAAAIGALEALSGRSAAVRELNESHERFSGGKLPAAPGSALGFDALQELPASGLMTPALHALRLLLAASHEHATRLSESGRALSAPGDTFFETAWGAEFSKRHGAQTAEDPAPLVKPLFDGPLAGVKADAAAAEHFAGYIKLAYGAEVAALLSSDAKAGAPSEELRAWARKYLADQRRLYALKRNRESIVELDGRKRLTRELADIARIASALSAKPDLPRMLKAVLGGAAPAGRVHLTLAGVHLQKPTRLGRHELGDSVVLSGAYWVDGLAEGERISVEETTFADLGAGGFQSVETRTERRGNGGPYAFSRSLTLTGSQPFTLRAVVGSAEGPSLSAALEVPVAPDFERAVERLGAADRSFEACRFKEAEESYEALAGALAEPAGKKKQYAGLAEAARKGAVRSRRRGAALAKLEELAAESRADASPQRCDYQVRRTQKALDGLRGLPPGCDRLVPELARQRVLIGRRAEDQRHFAALLKRGEGMRQECRFSAAADEWTRALAVLDADPAARCGATESAAGELSERLSSLRIEELHRRDLEGRWPSLKAAASGPEAALNELRPLLARATAMPTAACHARDISRGLELSARLGADLPAPGAAAARRLLPADGELARVSREVADEERRLRAAEAAELAKKQAEQAPAGQAPESPAPPDDATLDRLLKQETPASKPPAGGKAGKAARKESRRP